MNTCVIEEYDSHIAISTMLDIPLADLYESHTGTKELHGIDNVIIFKTNKYGSFWCETIEDANANVYMKITQFIE